MVLGLKEKKKKKRKEKRKKNLSHIVEDLFGEDPRVLVSNVRSKRKTEHVNESIHKGGYFLLKSGIMHVGMRIIIIL